MEPENQMGDSGAGQIVEDPHASKISPDDPRLKLPVAKSRSLKKGPVILIGSSVLGVVLSAFAVGVWPVDKSQVARKDDVAINQMFTIPDNIRKGPGNDAPVFAVQDSIPKLGEPLPGDLGHAMVDRHQPGSGNAQVQSPEEAERLAAIKASPFFGGNSSVPAVSSPPSMGSMTGAGTEAGQGSGYTYGRGQNMQDRKNDFFSHGAGDEKEYVAKSVRNPVSKYEVKAGSVIPVILVTAINSDLPGNVVAMVNENVYDSRTGECLLIPQGTRVLGRYDSMVSYGQKRVQVSWTRLVRPDGSSMVLENMPGVDLAGNSGYKDKVDNHFDRLVGGVALSSLLSVGATVSQGTYTDEEDMSTQQRMAAAVGQQISNVGSQITRKNLDIQPTLKILAGKKVNVLVNKDMILSPYNENS